MVSVCEINKITSQISLLIISYFLCYLYFHSILSDIPDLWHSRLKFYSNYKQLLMNESSPTSAVNNEESVISPSKFGNFIYSDDHDKNSALHTKRLICYYTIPREYSDDNRVKSEKSLRLKDFNPHLCSHINIGIITIRNCTLEIDNDLKRAFMEGGLLKSQNEKLKLLLWVGGADESTGFPEMVSSHANRKKFIYSLKMTLEQYGLDGIG
jgi:GH18 family chitinase